MTKRNFLLFVLSCTIFFSCKDYLKDDFQLSEPSSLSLNINFPSLVDFEIIQTVTPDQQGLTNEVANTFVISNELNQSISQLKFGINIFDSSDRFEKNLVVSYFDSIPQTLGAFGKTTEKLFNASFDAMLKKEMIDIFILDQDVSDTNPLSGLYIGEAFYFKSDTTPINIPYIYGAIDYKGDMQLRASGSQIANYNINGRMSTSGQFIGKTKSSDVDVLPSLDIQTKPNAVNSLQNGSLQLTFIPSESTSELDSITLSLNQN